MKMPTKEQILKASEDCPDAKCVLKKLFPEAFRDEWIDITKEVRFLPDSRQGNGYYWLGMYIAGAMNHFGFIDANKIEVCDDSKERYKIETGRSENGSTHFRILARR